ncbi:MAG TPA: hypothetical protein VFH88_13785 [Candidatus Krumholzibacteria bacterium]|nr:hypothetical protein [Candidatus Krumholzibacteria bacterium]
MKRRATTVWMCLMAVLCAGGLARGAAVRTAVDEVTTQTTGPTDSVTVGQRFHAIYKFTFADSLRPVVPRKINAGTCRVMNVDWNEARGKDTRIQRTADVTFIPLSVDSSVVPANAFDFLSAHGDTVRAWTDEIRVPIKRIAADAKDLNPLKAQWKAPPNYWLWAAIAALVLAAAAVLVWWIRRRRSRPGEAAPEVRLPPEVVALAELERIHGLGLPAQGEFKTHYTLVVDAVRRYIEARYGVEAMDQTTFELLGALDRRGVHVDGLSPLLDEADLVKFAKFAPTVESAAGAIDRARELIIHTTPVVPTLDPLAPSEPSASPPPAAGAS